MHGKKFLTGKMYKHKQSGAREKAVSEQDCKQYADTDDNLYPAPDFAHTWGHIPSGCVVSALGKVHYNKRKVDNACGASGYYCVEPMDQTFLDVMEIPNVKNQKKIWCDELLAEKNRLRLLLSNASCRAYLSVDRTYS